MAELNDPLWLQNGSHSSQLQRLLLQSLVAAEGVTDKSGGGLEVTEKSTPDMSVDVASGSAFVDGDQATAQGFYFVHSDATVNVTISAADATNPRKDLIVAQVYDSSYSGATDDWDLIVVTGTPAASPAEPSTPDDALVLALVDVAAGATSITNANITDRRTQAELRSQTLPAARARVKAATASAMSTTEQTKATATLTIPSSWSTYDVDVWATARVLEGTGATADVNVTVKAKVGGTEAGSTIEDVNAASVDNIETVAVNGYLEGQSTTGSVAVTLTTQLSGESGAFDVASIVLTAYAWRTS